MESSPQVVLENHLNNVYYTQRLFHSHMQIFQSNVNYCLQKINELTNKIAELKKRLDDHTKPNIHFILGKQSNDSSSSSSDSDDENPIKKRKINRNPIPYRMPLTFIDPEKVKNMKIDTLSDLIKVLNLSSYKSIVPHLEKLNNMIGMQKIKKGIVDQVIYYIQKRRNTNLLHTVIMGPPGTGKTMVGRILCHIYANIGIIANNFRIVKRSDLIAKYLGQTAIKTQKVFDSLGSGVLFIDEAYSLGNNEQRDIYSKECIDTINENLTLNKNRIIVIIAGYKKCLEECFFKYNEGLDRRFPFRYSIDPYTPEELRDIFIKMIQEDEKWNIQESCKDIILDCIKKNKTFFEHQGGDIENFVFDCKIAQSHRIFLSMKKDDETLQKEDILLGFKKFKKKKEKKEENIQIKYSMYI